MKIFFFLLISTFLFAQEITYIDTIFTYKNKPYPCLVENISDQYISFIYSNNKIKEKILIDGVSKLVIDSIGTVFTRELGYTYNLDKINTNIEKRNKTLLKLSRTKITSRDANITNFNDNTFKHQNTEIQNTIDVSKDENYLWSFGFIYTPFYFGKIYKDRLLDFDYYSLPFEPNVTNYTIMSGEFSYKIFNKLRLTLEMSYSSSTFDFQNNSTYRNSTDSSGLLKRYIDIEKFLFLNIGAKWYLKNFINNKVTPFLAIKFGKQFAIITQTSKNKTYPNNYRNDTDNNIEDFLQKLNSPLFISSSFGVEYYFNKSFSIISNMEIIYSSTSSLFKTRTVNESYKFTQIKKFSISDINSKFGIGLNFYF